MSGDAMIVMREKIGNVLNACNIPLLYSFMIWNTWS